MSAPSEEEPPSPHWLLPFGFARNLGRISRLMADGSKVNQRRRDARAELQTLREDIIKLDRLARRSFADALGKQR